MNEFIFLLDEHVSPALQRGLNRHYPEIPVFRIGQPGAPSLGTLDPDILEWCVVHHAVLITNNRASMPVHLKDRIEAGKYANGIITLNDGLSLGAVIEELAAIWQATSLEDHVNLIRYLPISS